MAPRAAAAVVVVLAMVCAAHSAAAAGGLSPDFHKKTCPQLDQIVEFHVAETFRRDVGVAPGLIRILFHDCFPQGCDASVLLTAKNGEQPTGPNLTLRPVALGLIQRIRDAVNTACKDKVSCADITVLATREALVKAGGPRFGVDLGRRDALVPARDQVVILPGPSFPVPRLIQSFKNRGLDVADLVALSGAHTFGVAHCSVFEDRFKPGFGPNPAIDPKFAAMLKNKCDKDFTHNATQNLDVRTPDAFDNQFYLDLVARQGLFRSDQALIDDPATKALATRFSLDQRAFFEQFAKSMTKMTNMDVLTGNQGEIRNNCAVPNKRVSIVETARGGDEGHAADM